MQYHSTNSIISTSSPHNVNINQMIELALKTGAVNIRLPDYESARALRLRFYRARNNETDKQRKLLLYGLTSSLVHRKDGQCEFILQKR